MRTRKSYSGKQVGKYIIPLIWNSKSTIKIVSPYLSPEYANLLIDKARSGVDVKIITSNEDNQNHQKALSILKEVSRVHYILTTFGGTKFAGHLKGQYGYGRGLGVLILIVLLFASYIWNFVSELLSNILKFLITNIIILSLGVGYVSILSSSIFIIFILHQVLKGVSKTESEQYTESEEDVESEDELIYENLMEGEYDEVLTKTKKKSVPEKGKLSNIKVKIVCTRDFVHSKFYIIDNKIAISGSANLTHAGMESNYEQIEIKSKPSEIKKMNSFFSQLW